MRRFWIVGMLALWASGIGCSGVTRRGDGFPPYRPGVMPAAPAPPQTQVLLPPERTDGASSAGSSTPSTGTGTGLGLAKFFPGIKKASAAPVEVASTGRSGSWFGFFKTKPSQVYATDARVRLNKGSEEPTLLPVALQVPTSDRSVTPTSAEVPRPSASSPIADQKPVADPVAELPAPAEAAPTTPAPLLNVDPAQLAKKESDPAQPQAPTPDPTEPTRPVAPAPAQAEPTAAVFGVPAQAEPAATVAAKPEPAPAERAERPRVEAPPEVQAPPAETKPTPTIPTTPDDQAVKAAPPIDPKQALTLPDPTMPASYSTSTNQSVASPQPTHDAHVHASPQVAPTAQSATTAAPAKTWKRPCLRRAVRKIWKLGEYANPPTAEPH